MSDINVEIRTHDGIDFAVCTSHRDDHDAFEENMSSKAPACSIFVDTHAGQIVYDEYVHLPATLELVREIDSGECEDFYGDPDFDFYEKEISGLFADAYQAAGLPVLDHDGDIISEIIWSGGLAYGRVITVIVGKPVVASDLETWDSHAYQFFYDENIGFDNADAFAKSGAKSILLAAKEIIGSKDMPWRPELGVPPHAWHVAMCLADYYKHACDIMSGRSWYENVSVHAVSEAREEFARSLRAGGATKAEVAEAMGDIEDDDPRLYEDYHYEYSECVTDDEVMGEAKRIMAHRAEKIKAKREAERIARKSALAKKKAAKQKEAA